MTISMIRKLIIILTVILFSCDKNPVEPMNESREIAFIVAGNNPENALYKESDVNINIVRNDSSAYLYGESDFINLSNNLIPDLVFEVTSIGIFNDYTTSCGVYIFDHIEVALIEGDTSFLRLFELGDTINSEANWKGKTGNDFNFAEVEFVLAEFSYFANGNDMISIDSTGSWNNTIDGYLGIREITPSDTSYGWVRLDIMNHYHLKVKDHAIQSNED